MFGLYKAVDTLKNEAKQYYYNLEKAYVEEVCNRYKKDLRQCAKLQIWVGVVIVVVIVSGGKQSQILLCRLCQKYYFMGFAQLNIFFNLKRIQLKKQ